MLLTLTNCIITAYVATGNLDASGHIPKENYTIASARRDIPLGSKAIINGREYVINDHMNKRFNGTDRFDIFMGTNVIKAKQFGIKRKQTITIK